MPLSSLFHPSRLKRRQWLSAAALLLTLPMGLSGQNTATVADGYDPNVNGIIFSVVVQSDGKSLVGGSFSSFSPNAATTATTRNNLARVNIDGTLDSSFNPDVNGQVNVILVQPDGKIVIGGVFSTVGGVARGNLARLNADGSLDGSFGVSATATLAAFVNSLAIQADGKILVGGNFTGIKLASGTITARNYVARINSDGTLDTGFAASANGPVQSIGVQADGRIVIGGLFTSITSPTTTVRNHIARLNADGTLDTGFDPNTDGNVSVITIQADGGILIGGFFGTFQPNGSATTAFRRRIARLNIDGTIDTTFINTNAGVGGAPSNVTAIMVQPDGYIVVGGYFQSIDGANANFCARLKPTGEIDTGFDPGVNYVVNAIGLQQDGRLVLGGNFTQSKPGGSLVASARNHLVRVAPNGVTDASFTANAGGRVSQITVQSDGKSIIGGDFTSIGGVSRRNIARLNTDGSLDTSFNPDVDGPVLCAVIQSNGKLVIGGTFQNVGGASHKNIARLNTDGSVDSTFDINTTSGSTTGGTVNAMAIAPDGKIYLGGSFTRVFKAGEDASAALGGFIVARVSTDGAVDLTFEPNIRGDVTLIKVLADGNIIIAGSFVALQNDSSGFPVPQQNITRYSPDGILDFRFSVAPGYSVGGGGFVNAVEVQPDGKLILGGTFDSVTVTSFQTGVAVTTKRNNIARVSTTGEVDTSFDPNINGSIFEMIRLSDGRIIAAGAFTGVRPNGATETTPIRHIARFNSDGTLDPTFNPGPSASISAMVQQADGRILIGGSFISFQAPGASSPTARNRIARLSADGVIDAAYDPNFSNVPGAAVNALALQGDGALLVGGVFSDLSGASVQNLVRFRADGIPDGSFISAITGTVNAIGVRQISAPPTSPLHGFAWLAENGLLQTGFNPPTTTEVRGLIRTTVQAPGGAILLAGSFTITGTDVGPNLARFSSTGALDTSFKVNVKGEVDSLAVQADGKIVIGGNFSQVNGVGRNNLARVNPDGSLDTAYDPNLNGTVFAMQLLADGRILAAGSFVSANPNGATTGSSAHQLVRINPDGTIDSTIDANTDGTVYAFAIQPDGKIVLGGSFHFLQPLRTGDFFARDNIARLNADGTMDASFDAGTSDIVRTIALQSDGKVVIGGDFRNVNDVERGSIARLNVDGSIDLTFDPNANAAVSVIRIRSDGKFLLAGDFTRIGSVTRNHLARLLADGTVDADFDPNVDASVDTLTLLPDNTVFIGGDFAEIRPTGVIYVGGGFTAVNGAPVSNIARVNSVGTADGSFRPNPNGAVNAILVLPDSRLIIAGAFTSTSGVARNRIARYNADGTLDTGFNPGADGEIRTIALQGDGKIVIGGSFATVGGVSRSRIARLNTDGSVDSSFDPGANDVVSTLVVDSDGTILVGGSFTTTGGASRNRIARLTSSGTASGSFNPGANGVVNAIALQANGQILVGGLFTSIGGGTRNFLARLTSTGALDSTFDPAPDGAVNAFAIQTDGKPFVGGAFSRISGAPRYRFARLSNNAYSTQSLTISSDYSTLLWTRGGPGPEVSWVSFEYSVDGRNWTFLGAGARVGSGWAYSGSVPPDAMFFARVRGGATAGQNTSTGLVEAVAQFFPRPVITSSGTASGTRGVAFSFTVSATHNPTNFSATGLPLGLSINPLTGAITGTPLQNGSFVVSVVVANGAGSRPYGLILTIAAGTGSSLTGSDAALINTSTRALVTAGNPLFVGFVISGTESQSVLIRGVGPSLAAYKVGGVLAVPHVTVFNSARTAILDAGRWDSSAAMSDLFGSIGAFPLVGGGSDVAFVMTLPPGAYTAQLSDGGTGGGVALAEVYAVGGTHLANLSARGPSVGGGNPLIAGLVINGTSAKQFLIRGIGPALTGFGVGDALSDSIVGVYNNLGELVAQNDNWTAPLAGGASAAEIAAAGASVGAFPLNANSRDGAVIVILAPGSYTVQVSGAGNTTGSGLAEVYELPY